MNRMRTIGAAALALAITVGGGVAVAQFPLKGYLDLAVPDTTTVAPPATSGR